MLIITTAISGSRRKEYLRRFEERAKKEGKKIKIYHVGEMMLEHSRAIGINFKLENILNSPPSVINAVRSAVFEKITAELPLELKRNHVVFINIHTMFFWKKVFLRAWDNYYVGQLNPDMFLAFVDDVLDIAKNLKDRAQWKKEKLTTNDLLMWRNVDVEMAASWAEMKKKQFYIIPAPSNEKLLFRLLFEPHREKIYAAMPITHFTSPKDQRTVDQFIKKLEKYFIIFDPREIEMIEQWKSSIKTDAVLHQIVNRDLYWLIRQVDRVIAYFPKAVSSPGVMNELREAHETNKEAWLVYPKEAHMSPFLSYYSNMIFRGPESLFKFLNAEKGVKNNRATSPKKKRRKK